MPASLRDRRILVIGRSGGIARAIVEAVREAGGTVVVAGRDQAALAAAYEEPGIAAEQVDVADLDHDTVTRSFTVKVVGPMFLAKHFAPRMPEDGSFVLFSGSSARKPAIGMLAVGATNAAVDAVTRALAVELAPIRVNAISPGTVDTGAYDGLGAEKQAELFAVREAGSPARRVGRSADIAEAVVFALTSTFMTGVSLGIDGGEPLV